MPTHALTNARKILTADGAFGVMSGIALLALAGPISNLAGITQHRIPMVVGGALLIYGADMLLSAFRTRSRLAPEAPLYLAGDALWIAGSIVVILAAPITATGALLTGASAVAVAALGFAKLRAFRAAGWGRTATTAEAV